MALFTKKPLLKTWSNLKIFYQTKLPRELDMEVFDIDIFFAPKYDKTHKILYYCLSTIKKNLFKGIESLPQTLISNHYIFGTKCWRPKIFQTMNSVRSNILSLNYQRFTTSGFSEMGFWIFEFVTKTQFL